MRQRVQYAIQPGLLYLDLADAGRSFHATPQPARPPKTIRLNRF